MSTFKHSFLLVAFLYGAEAAFGQAIQMTEVLIMNSPELKKGVSGKAFKSFITAEIEPVGNNDKAGINFHLLQADRGDRKGEFLLVYTVSKLPDRKKALPSGSPFTDRVLTPGGQVKLSSFISNQQSFTEYHLIGADQLRSLPEVGILGIHYIKVKSDRAKDFEKFVTDKMHPIVANLLPDMHLLTYKATDGDQRGMFITIFAIKSIAARDAYWPLGKPETERLKQAFLPLRDLSLQLKEFLIPGTYLEPSGGAAAIFESKEWTDYVLPSDVTK